MSWESIQRIMNPRSVLIAGMSSRPGSPSHVVLQNLLVNGYSGAIHLYGRTPAEVDGYRIETDAGRIPDDIDLAILVVPASAVEETVRLCVSKRVGGAVVFAGGFAEAGEEGRQLQDRVLAAARTGDLRVIGPNCLGFTNFTTGFMAGFVKLMNISRLDPSIDSAVAIVGQSGGMQAHLQQSLEARGVSVSYSISTGNEMDLGMGDFINFLIEDAATRVIAIYAEHIADPEAFIAAARKAASKGKPIVLLHPGKSARAQDAARSHTGSMVGNHAVMTTRLRREGIVLVDTVDEWLDVAELLSRYPHPQPGGLGVLSLSGAFSGVALDLCSELGIEVPELSPEGIEALAPKVPAFIPPRNPLDLGTQPAFQPELIGIGLEALLAERNIGAVVCVIPMGPPATSVAYLQGAIAAMQKSPKPVAYNVLNDRQPLPDEMLECLRTNRVVWSRAPDRMIRAMSKLIRRGNLPVRATTSSSTERPIEIPELRHGVQPEWYGKQILQAAGIAVPKGRLATSQDEAVRIADEIGYPVVLKGQSAALAHKTEAGAVRLNLKDADDVRRAWREMTASIQAHHPGLVLDGMLVESMSLPGLEMVVGATRDPVWGPMVMVGLGGIYVELLKDVRLIVPDAGIEEILAELDQLKTARLLHGFRNQPPVDRRAVAEVVSRVGALMRQHPSIQEIDINPLMVHGEQQGATALDALIVAG